MAAKHTPGLDPRCSCKAVPGRFLFCPMHAAAPELLDALEQVAHERDFVVRCNDHIQGIVRAAIAKARGES